MALAILYGTGSGALHAVTGPDHVLSLGPVALQRRDAAFRIGLTWGAGHAIGTLLLALPLLALSHAVHLPSLAAWGDRLAGVALLVAAGVALWSRQRAHTSEPSGMSRPLFVGFVHGISGAGSLLLVLPVVLTGSLDRVLLYLAAFSAGSALAMALVTTLIARLGARLERYALDRVQLAMIVTSAALGLWWLAASS